MFEIRKHSCAPLILESFFYLLLYIYHCLAPLPSLMQLSNLSENEDVLLEFFVSLPQLKQVTSDKGELVTNIVDMASKFLLCPWSEGLDG